MEDTQTSIWNFDGAELMLIFEIKKNIVEYLDSWDLGNAYKKVRLLRMEIDAKLKREKAKKDITDFDKPIEKKKEKNTFKTEKQEVDEMMVKLDNAYNNFIIKDEPEDSDKSLFYQEIEFVYMHLCFLMKKHGLYFREGEDNRLAVTRR